MDSSKRCVLMNTLPSDSIKRRVTWRPCSIKCYQHGESTCLPNTLTTKVIECLARTAVKMCITTIPHRRISKVENTIIPLPSASAKYKDGKKPCGWEDGASAKPKTISPIGGTEADEPKKHTPVKTDPRTYLIDWHDGN